MRPSGERYFDDCRRILSDITEAEAVAAGSYANPSGTLSVTASAMFGQMYVLPIMTEFLDAHDAMLGRTLFINRPVNVVEESVDVAIRIGHLPDSGFTAIRVGSVRRVICGAPSHLESAGFRPHRLSFSGVALRERRTHNPYPNLQCNTNETTIVIAIDGWALTRVLRLVRPCLMAACN